jgi:hypothetical protein
LIRFFTQNPAPATCVRVEARDLPGSRACGMAPIAAVKWRGRQRLAVADRAPDPPPGSRRLCRSRVGRQTML